jgi:hypothetical protein
MIVSGICKNKKNPGDYSWGLSFSEYSDAFQDACNDVNILHGALIDLQRSIHFFSIFFPFLSE